MKVGVLALQGAFIEHELYYKSLGHEVFEIRQRSDLSHFSQPVPHSPFPVPQSLLILPGGESTVQVKLLKDLGLFEPIKELIAAGLPTVGTCAGLILLANHFKLLPVTVKRNAYGRQLGSFTYVGTFDGKENVPMTFIRAPAIEAVSGGVEVLSTFEGAPTAVRYQNITAYCWHPELN